MPESPLGEGDKPTTDARVGTILSDRYRIDALLGEGGMGKVYAAEHVLMKKRLAVKVLHRELTTVPEVVARFEREAMAAANIEHANVAAATDFGKLADGSVFLVLEYVQGTSLRDEIARGPFNVERALRIARQIASALGSAHGLSIVHRDLKPENVMLVEKAGDRDFVKVLDFGIARVPIGELKDVDRPSGAPITKAGMVFGTPEYMAPEQALGQAVDGRADLYALGVILFEMLAGSRPFSSKSQVGILGQQLSKPPPTFAERAPGIQVPPAVEQVVRKLLAREVGERYQRAAEAITAIDAVMGQASVPGTRLFTAVAGSPRDVLGSQPAISAPLPSFVNEPSLAIPPEVLARAEARAAAAPLNSPAPPRESESDARAAAGVPVSGGAGPLPPPPRLPSGGTGVKAWLTASVQSLKARAKRFKVSSPRASFASGGKRLSKLPKLGSWLKRTLVDRALHFIDARRARLPPKLQNTLRHVPSAALLFASVLIAIGGLIALVGLVVAAVRPPPAPLAGASSSALGPGPPPTTGPAAATAPGDRASTQEIEQAKAGGSAELEKLVNRYPNDLNVLLELAQSQLDSKQPAAAVGTVASALVLDTKAAEDPRVFSVLKASAMTKESMEASFALLQGPMGFRGADVIYEVTRTEGVRPDVKQRADRFINSKEFDRASSPALNVAVALRNAKSCQQRYGLLLRAKNVGDERSLVYLKELTNRSGCGPTKGDDCHACLRADDRLDQAISAVEARKKG